jgi:hypothetical protein
MKSYKIRSKKTGLYSTAGYIIKWNKTGKIWNQLNHATTHLNHKAPEYNEDIEIVEFELLESSVIDYDLKTKKLGKSRVEKMCENAVKWMNENQKDLIESFSYLKDTD